MAPILKYLQRCTTTFSTLITMSIMLILVIGLILRTMKLLCRFEISFQQIDEFFVTAHVFLYFVTAILCFILYGIEKYVVRRDKQILFKIYDFFVPIKVVDKENNVDFMYTHYIPAMHMIAYLTMGISGTYMNICGCIYVYMCMSVCFFIYIHINKHI
jgi:hypothetical protein